MSTQYHPDGSKTRSHPKRTRPTSDWGPWRDVTSPEMERLKASNAELLEACEYAAELVRLARQYFPKSIKNRHRYSLETYNAAIGNAIAKAKGQP